MTTKRLRNLILTFQKKHFFNFVFILILSLSFGCTKEEVLTSSDYSKLKYQGKDSDGDLITIGDGGTKLESYYRSKDNNLVMTVLGRKRNNPFSKKIMTKAANLIYGDKIKKLPTTHYYVKFEPKCDKDLEELRLFALNNKIPLFDFPLEYEIKTMGDYYCDPKVTKKELTFQYAVIPQNVTIPNVPHKVVDDLILVPIESYLSKVAFDVAKEEHPGEVNLNVEWPDYLKGHFNIPDEPDEVIGDCQCDAFSVDFNGQINYDDVKTVYRKLYEGDDCSDYDGTKDEMFYYFNCHSYTHPPHNDKCSCRPYGNEREPAGRVQVRNYTTNKLEGLRKATIHLKDNWFFTDIVFTDDDGCWEVNNEYYGRLWMWVKFYNEDATIRVKRGWLHQGDLLWPADDYIRMFWGPRFNNICVEYLGDNNIKGTNQMYWAAATTHNAIQEYHDNPDGIPIHQDLNIILANSESNDGGAPMLHNSRSSMTDIVDFLVILGLGPVGFVASIGLHDILYPDITYRYRNLNGYPGGSATFQIRNTILHECAHASHHFIATGFQLSTWDKIRFHIIANNGYGSPGNFASIGSNPQFVAVAEGWAYHYYGDDLVGNPRLESRHFRNGFIPWGLGLDLRDPRNPFDPSRYNDEVEGFTNLQYFNALTPATVTMQKLRDIYLNDYLPSTTNTAKQVNNLFDQYNF